MQLSGVLKRVAVKLSKICNDLRLLSSGPRAGFGEINLPPVQAGLVSIMPGKVNPVIPEVVNQVAFEVIGNDVTVTLGRRGRPAAAQRLRADHRAQPVQERRPTCAHGCLTLAERCVDGITANRERCAAVVERLDRHRDGAQSLYRLRQRDRGRAGGACVGRGASYELVLEKGLLSKEQLDEILRPEILTRPQPILSSVRADGEVEAIGAVGPRYGPARAVIAELGNPDQPGKVCHAARPTRSSGCLDGCRPQTAAAGSALAACRGARRRATRLCARSRTRWPTW